MNYHYDPTANQALGSITREWNRMSKLASEIKKNPYSDWSLEQSRKFTGIFKRLLIDDNTPGKAS